MPEAFVDTRPRVLCLHGFRGNAQAMRMQMKFANVELPTWFNFIFLDGPKTMAPDKTSPLQGFAPGPFYEWWNASDDGKYDGLESVVEHLAAALQKHHPVQGVFGFSQGAAVALYLCKLRQMEDPRIPTTLSFAFAWGEQVHSSRELAVGRSVVWLRTALCMCNQTGMAQARSWG
eukprot:NODE_7028_length_799_cov_54.038462_g6790_i0.p1 GENE.NODE_7028_length_799_cov_54.038462_g6790_i0~~NODE_7028_length_799_cov_54.038462_g6790_i0.p1  ORF type:complete len:192 (-),score=42.87 NODE_7028_length_799_cov_54.038462_g6790_i0:224-748(-)